MDQEIQAELQRLSAMFNEANWLLDQSRQRSALLNVEVQIRESKIAELQSQLAAISTQLGENEKADNEVSQA